jgi:hypothetical protein
MMLVIPRTQINRQRTMMKYGCRNENVGIEKCHSGRNRLANIIESAQDAPDTNHKPPFSK